MVSKNFRGLSARFFWIKLQVLIKTVLTKKNPTVGDRSHLKMIFQPEENRGSHYIAVDVDSIDKLTYRM